MSQIVFGIKGIIIPVEKKGTNEFIVKEESYLEPGHYGVLGEEITITSIDRREKGINLIKFSRNWPEQSEDQ